MLLRKLLLFPAIFGLTLSCFAQVNIIVKPTSPYRYSVSNIWDINISVGSEASVVISAQVRKGLSDQIYTSTSEPVALKAGFNSLNIQNVKTASSAFSDLSYRQWHDVTGGLPPGNYSICYTVKCATSNCNLNLDDKHCEEIKIETPTPLLLSTPSDKEVINDKTPLLTWVPPAPVSPQADYKLTLVEIREGQSKMDAILRNRPIIEAAKISNIVLQYPPDLEELIEGKSYAWTVEAQFNDQTIAKSEVWEFSIGKDTLEKKEETIHYIKVRELLPSSSIKVENYLRLDYHEIKNREGELNVIIQNKDGKNKAEFNKKIIYGENLLDFSLAGIGLKSEEEYTALISGPDGKTYKIKFTYSHTY